MGENAIQGMKEFKTTYFYKDTNVPEQSILIFDESQRAWDAEMLGRGFTEPEGLFRVGERIYENRDYAVLIGLYGNDQVDEIYNFKQFCFVLTALSDPFFPGFCIIYTRFHNGIVKPQTGF